MTLTTTIRLASIVRKERAAQARDFTNEVTAQARILMADKRANGVLLVKHCKAVVHGFTDAGNLRAGLSNPLKMPGKGWGLTALAACPTGAKLATHENTVCSDCYACKGNYTFPSVAGSLRARLDIVTEASESVETAARWVAAMARLIDAQSPSVFRWHDSGDLFSDRYYSMILAVIALTPNCSHWIPTKEATRVALFHGSRASEADMPIPENLTLRLSAPMLATIISPRADLLTRGVRTSSAGADDTPTQCPAPTQNGECRDCRTCWGREAQNVNYHQH